MKMRSGIKVLVGSAFALAACTSFQKSGQRGVASSSSDVFGKSEPRVLSDSEVRNYTSSDGMTLKNTRILKDNYQAWKSKVDIIQSAKTEINLVYFIYSDDFSSSQLTTELIAAAKRKVKVNIMVDFITNYDRIDLFRYMEQAGSPNLKVKFYGMPTDAIKKGAVYQTIPCEAYKPEMADEESCRKSKEALVAQMGNPEKTWFSTMYLTGLYGKNNVLMGTATQLGGQFDPKAVASQNKTMSSADAKKLGQLIVNAKLKNDFSSKLKLSSAMTSQGDTIGPIINEFTGRLPLYGGGGDDWNHLSDYTHHKLIVADGFRFQLGGRNVEDSYHTDLIQKQFSDSKGKYTFMDTDFYGEGPQVTQVQDAYEKLFSFGAMVGDLSAVEKYVPNEYNENTEAFQAAIGTCLQNPPDAGLDLEACVNKNIGSQKGYIKLNDRLAAIASSMKTQAGKFASYKQAPVPQWIEHGTGPAHDQFNLSNAKVYYIENLPFNKSNPSTRTFDPVVGREIDNGKGIHALWARGIENACKIATEAKPQRVILHSAYFFMPTPVLNAVAKAINGSWDCHNVKIQFITNSAQTTDLAPVNLFARNQLRSLFRFYNSQAPSDKKATLEYFEYLETAPNVLGRSLHTKISVLGNDMIIGSANADVRSYAMDTNNGVFIRGAQTLVDDYVKYVDSLSDGNSPAFAIWQRGFYILKLDANGNPTIGPNGHFDVESYEYGSVTDELLNRQTDMFLGAMAQRWLTPKDEDLAKMKTPEEKQTYLDKKKKDQGSFIAKKPAIEKMIRERGAAIEKLTDKLLKSSGLYYSDTDIEQALEKACIDFDKSWQTL